MSAGVWRWVGTRTAPESSRAFGESFLTLAVGDLASLSLWGDTWSGACGDGHLKGLKARGCHSSGLVHLRSPALSSLEHRGSHGCAPSPARMLSAARGSSVLGEQGAQTCPAWSRGPAHTEKLSLASPLWLCSLFSRGYTCQGPSTMSPLAAGRKPAKSIQMTALELGKVGCAGEKDPLIKISKSESTVPRGPQIPESSVSCWLLSMFQNKSIGSLFNEEAFVT